MTFCTQIGEEPVWGPEEGQSRRILKKGAQLDGNTGKTRFWGWGSQPWPNNEIRGEKNCSIVY